MSAFCILFFCIKIDTLASALNYIIKFVVIFCMFLKVFTCLCRILSKKGGDSMGIKFTSKIDEVLNAVKEE